MGQWCWVSGKATIMERWTVLQAAVAVLLRSRLCSAKRTQSQRSRFHLAAEASRRIERPALVAARRGRGDFAVDLAARHPLRHGVCRSRGRRHRPAQAREHNTPGIPVERVRLCIEAGFPPGVFELVTGRGSEVGERLIASARGILLLGPLRSGTGTITTG